MTRDEFIQEHSEEVWQALVEPMQVAPICHCRCCLARRCNANILVHDMILRYLDVVGVVPSIASRVNQ